MSDFKKKICDLGLVLFISSLALGAILPSVLWNTFSLINDGISVLTGQRMLVQGCSVSFKTFGNTGRFFPAYWWYHALLVSLFGDWPTGFYMVHAALFLITCILAFQISNILTGSIRWASLSVPFLLLSSTFSESFYVLGNNEPLCVLYIALIFWILYRDRIRPSHKPYAAVIEFMLVMLLFSVCLLTKETAVIMIPLSLLAWIIAVLGSKGRGFSRQRRPYFILFVSSVPAGIVFFALRFWYQIPSVKQGNYTSQLHIAFSTLIQMAFQYLRKCPDMIIDGVLLVGLLSLILINYSKTEQYRERVSHAIIFSLYGFGFFGVYLFWPRAEAYYLWISHFFFSIGLVLCLALIKEIFFPRRTDVRPLIVFLFTFLIGVAVVSRGIGGIIAQNQARSLIQWNTVNRDLLQYLSSNVPRNGRIVFWNYDFPHELIFESELQLHTLMHREDLKIIGLGGRLMKTSFRFQPGDYLVVNFGQLSPALVTFRGPSNYPRETARSFLASLGYSLNFTKEVTSRSTLFDPVTAKSSLFSTGWDIFVIEKPGPVRNCDLWADGWMGKTANFFLENDAGNSRIHIDFSTVGDALPADFLPVAMHIVAAGKIIETKIIEKPGDYSLSILLNTPENPVHVQIVSEKTISPQSVNPQSRDGRQLSFHFRRVATSR